LLEILLPPLKALSNSHALRLKLVGTCGEQELKAFDEVPSLQTEQVDSLDWSDSGAVSRAISEFDIGLYPLRQNYVNHYKCGFKAVEYSTMEIPVVASPVANNADVVAHGETGYLADSSQEWVTWLDELIGNPAKRSEMGLQGRRRMETKFNIVVVAERLANIFRAQ
jgi:glycosyltransferase involved in cell wall biosynthesis